MQVEWHTDARGDFYFSGVLRPHDMQNLKLDRIDRATVTAPIEKASDLFQTLQIFAFRMEQQAERKAAAEK